MSREVRRLSTQRDIDGLISVAVDRTRKAKERIEAIGALGDLGDSRAVEPLIPLIRQVGVTVASAEALTKIGDGCVAPHLLYLAQSHNSSVRRVYQSCFDLLLARDKEGVEAAIIAFAQRMDAGKTELRARWLTKVESWQDCPLCRQPFTARVEHALHCEPCGHYFTDANYLPHVSLHALDYGALQSAEFFVPSPEMLQYYGQPLGMPQSGDGPAVNSWTTAIAWLLVDDTDTREMLQAATAPDSFLMKIEKDDSHGTEAADEATSRPESGAPNPSDSPQLPKPIPFS